MGTIRDFLRGFRRGFAAADPLPRVPVACAVVVFLAGIVAAGAGEGGEAVLCGIIAATFIEVAVLRREVRRARAAEAYQARRASRWMNACEASFRAAGLRAPAEAVLDELNAISAANAAERDR